MLKYLAILSWMFLIFLNHVVALNEIKQTANTSDIAVVDWYLELTGSQDDCVTFRADGQLTSLDVSLVFQSQGSEESWPRDMFILMKLLNSQTDLPEACYQFGGYDVTVN